MMLGLKGLMNITLLRLYDATNNRLRTKLFGDTHTAHFLGVPIVLLSFF